VIVERLHDYLALEKKLTAIVDDLANALATDEREEVTGYVKVNEFGIALETLCSILGEKQIGVPSTVISLIQDVGTQMGMDSATWNGLAVKK
jgi:hypothetical protein